MLAVARLAFLAVTLGAGPFISTAASAQATRTWVSGVGDDAAACGREDPCKTFAGAYAKTAAGGEINCLDPGDFGPVSITRSLTIDCDKTGGHVQITDRNGFFILAPNAVVTLSGLDIDGSLQTPDVGFSGITVLDAASVQVRNTSIRGFRYAWGMQFTPYNGVSSLNLDNVTFADNGLRTPNSSWTGGLYLTPSGGPNRSIGALRVTIANSHFIGNYNAGVRVVLPNGSLPGSVYAVISGSDFASTRYGAAVLAYGMPGSSIGRITLVNSSIAGNQTGISIDTTDASQIAMSVGGTSITGNGIGLQLLNAGQLRSFGDNRLAGNSSNGAFTAPIVPKR